jgi:hypothetical protein
MREKRGRGGGDGAPRRGRGELLARCVHLSSLGPSFIYSGQGVHLTPTPRYQRAVAKGRRKGGGRPREVGPRRPPPTLTLALAGWAHP